MSIEMFIPSLKTSNPSSIIRDSPQLKIKNNKHSKIKGVKGGRVDKGNKTIKSYFNLQKGKTESSENLPINSLGAKNHHLNTEFAESTAKFESSIRNKPTEAELENRD